MHQHMSKVSQGSGHISHNSQWSQKAWRRRIKPSITPKSSMEKAQIMLRRRERRLKYYDAYKSASTAIMEEAQKLSEIFGKHNPKQCYQILLQGACISQKTRKINPWNAYLHEEVRQWNACKYFPSPCIFID